jgi:hypothetical protein
MLNRIVMVVCTLRIESELVLMLMYCDVMWCCLVMTHLCLMSCGPSTSLFFSFLSSSLFLFSLQRVMVETDGGHLFGGRLFGGGLHVIGGAARDILVAQSKVFLPSFSTIWLGSTTVVITLCHVPLSICSI